MPPKACPYGQCARAPRFVHVHVERFPYGHVEDNVNNVNGSGMVPDLGKIK
jgi:hypothetical protein